MVFLFTRGQLILTCQSTMKMCSHSLKTAVVGQKTHVTRGLCDSMLLHRCSDSLRVENTLRTLSPTVNSAPSCSALNHVLRYHMQYLWNTSRDGDAGTSLPNGRDLDVFIYYFLPLKHKCMWKTVANRMVVDAFLPSCMPFKILKQAKLLRPKSFARQGSQTPSSLICRNGQNKKTGLALINYRLVVPFFYILGQQHYSEINLAKCNKCLWDAFQGNLKAANLTSCLSYLS